jgi:hypothetical protein
MRGAIPPLPQYVFMAWCLVKHRDNFTFTFASLEFTYVSCTVEKNFSFFSLTCFKNKKQFALEDSIYISHMRCISP